MSDHASQRLFVKTCAQCGHRSYVSRKIARRAARMTYPGEHMDEYRCPAEPIFWHFGRIHDGLVAGDNRVIRRRA